MLSCCCHHQPTLPSSTTRFASWRVLAPKRHTEGAIVFLQTWRSWYSTTMQYLSYGEVPLLLGVERLHPIRDEANLKRFEWILDRFVGWIWDEYLMFLGGEWKEAWILELSSSLLHQEGIGRLFLIFWRHQETSIFRMATLQNNSWRSGKTQQPGLPKHPYIHVALTNRVQERIVLPSPLQRFAHPQSLEATKPCLASHKRLPSPHLEVKQTHRQEVYEARNTNNKITQQSDRREAFFFGRGSL